MCLANLFGKIEDCQRPIQIDGRVDQSVEQFEHVQLEQHRHNENHHKQLSGGQCRCEQGMSFACSHSHRFVSFVRKVLISLEIINFPTIQYFLFNCFLFSFFCKLKNLGHSGHIYFVVDISQ